MQIRPRGGPSGLPLGYRAPTTSAGCVSGSRKVVRVIPGSVGNGSYIVEGEGTAASWTWCSDGAGRRHSRTEARKLFR